ncbi:H(+)/Cl(-) exchange transporter 7-like isoform X2 [Stegodyphus dumicola]|uniref:H(+)/Cl(-) exchange transporter 7-like isoform X2 n=1 Tax=Stegodyphus dumicola TaxID=202533 RepID=UPI0015B1BA0A|nr:H(+)/Cl(-) exchange transporter 7-like isoform X2 [Stegodyphus dumicola]
MEQTIKHRVKLKGDPSNSSPTERTPLLQPVQDSSLVVSDEGDSHSVLFQESQNSFGESYGSINRKLSIELENLLSQKYESLDYDICENSLFTEQQNKKSDPFFEAENSCMPKLRCIDAPTKISFMRWFVICLIGILTAFVAVAITIAIEELSTLKFNFLKQKVDNCTNYSCLLKPYYYWLLFSAVPVAVGSALVVFVAPVAAGSGIPVIKCYLNGVKVPEVVRLKTLIVKAVGVITSVVGGLAVGKEGPMIHCGAVIAAGISQGKSTSLRKNCKIFVEFREDHEKRDFVSAGAAAGVAAAFGAPVGGVLFSLEEGASFWNQSLTWRIFFCSMVSYFTLNAALSEYSGHFGQLSYPGLINFGKFNNLDYTVAELPLYIIMGVIGGMLGALYNQMNYVLTVFRLRYVKHPLARIFEAVMVSMVGVTIAFLSTFINDCYPYENSQVKFPVELACDSGQYNTFWSIWFQTPESCLRSLLHDSEGTWHATTLCLFFFAYLFLGCWTYGLSISSGLFIPTLMIGAAWGRLFGLGIAQIGAFFGFSTDSLCYSKFAIVGAAAMLGGVVRMTISLTVILMEAIGNITFGLPLMMAVMTAKWIGDLFNEGVYDIHIQLASVPFLGWEPPPYSYTIYATEIMSYPVVCFKSIENVGYIEDILKTESHNGFPVVDVTQGFCDRVHTFGKFQGMILRWQLIVLLQHKVFIETSETSQEKRLCLKDFRDSYPRHPTIQQIHISPHERNYSINLKPYMNISAYTISEKASLPRIFRLFRALGLRHLPVIDDKNSVVGIVTRKDIARFRARKDGKYGLEELQVSYA